jgi:Ni/Co efflux regulator RcnB
MTRREHEQFVVAKRIIEAVHRRLGVEYRYLARDWVRDQRLMRESVRRKRELRQQEQAQVAQFESWRRGQPVPIAEPEAPEEQRQAS